MINPKNIDAPGGIQSPHLDQTIIDIINGVSAIRADLDVIETSLENIDEQDALSEAQMTSLTNEVQEARLGSSSLKQKLEELRDRQIDMVSIKLSYEKTITTVDSAIMQEVFVGDISQSVEYVYDDGRLIEKKLMINGVQTGSILFEYNADEKVSKEIHNGFDTFNVASDSITMMNILNRLNYFENMNLLNRINILEEKTQVIDYDGSEIQQELTSVKAKVMTLEGVAFNQIDTIANVPELTERIMELEFEHETPQYTDKFIFDGTALLNLQAAAANNIEVTCDGLILTEGQNNDFVLTNGNQAIMLHTMPLIGSVIRCKYY